ncbi:hypothetical protein [Hyphobacterium sp.]|uniref:hypothetical protein n=1 Tax=Hyphobacterium sp. TaxID=2004662 RepID=UPI003BA9A20A
MSIQALAPVIESCLYKDTEYAILLAIANYANEDGYAAVGYDTIAEEARKDTRHIKRVIKRMTDQAEAAIGASSNDWAVRKISVGGGPYGTNEYQLNLARFEAAQAKVKEMRRARRQKRQMARGGGVADCHPPGAIRGDNSGRQGGAGTTQEGDSRSHPIPSLLFYDPTRAREPGEGSRSARELEPVDWAVVRKAMRDEFGQEIFASRLARLKCEGQLVVAPDGHYRDDVFARCGEWLKGQGLAAISAEDDVREFAL